MKKIAFVLLVMYSCSEQKEIPLVTDAIKLAEAKVLYEKKCTKCHKITGAGNDKGPNLTDNYWIHGNSPADIYNVISRGVKSKNKPSWKEKLTSEQIQGLMSYVLIKLQGTKPKNGKEPEGKKY
jgi:cytochrome c oxidase cbb3-type subunit 3